MFEYHRRCATSAATEAASSGCPPARVAARGDVAPLLVDLGNTLSLDAVDAASQYAAWDAEVAPADVTRALALEFGILGSDFGVTASSSPPSLLPQGSAAPPWLEWPSVIVRNDSTLALAVSLETPARVAALPAAGSAPAAGSKRRRADEDAEGCSSSEAPDATLAATGVSPADARLCTVGVSVTRSSVFVAGRYVKSARGLSQSSWFLQGKR